MQGIFVGTSFNGNINQFRKIIEHNDFINSYFTVEQLVKKNDFKQAKNIVNNFLSNDNKVFAYKEALKTLYNNHLEHHVIFKAT